MIKTKSTYLLYYLRFSPFDNSTKQGRADERHRQILLTTISSAGSRVLAAIISFATIPLTLHYLGAERFGLWSTISSILAMLSFADLGVGSGLMNEVATAHGKNDVEKIKTTIATGFILLSAISFAMVFIYFLINPYFNWGAFLNVKSLSVIQEVDSAIIVAVTLFALTLPAGIPIKVLMGLQKGFAANCWISIAAIFGLFGLLVVIRNEYGLPILVAVTTAPPVVAGVISGIYLFLYPSSQIKPSFVNVKIADFKALAGTSGLFLILQICGVIAFQADSIIISHFLGAESVATYAIVFKLFTIPSIIMSLFLNALWPAYAAASSAGDSEWILKSFFRSLKLSAALAIPISFIILLGSPWIINLWVGNKINPSWDLLIGMFLWSLLTILGGNFSVLLNGLGVIKFQTVASVAMSVINIILSIYLVKILGVSGVIWGSVISLALVLYVPTAIYIKRIFDNQQ